MQAGLLGEEKKEEEKESRWAGHQKTQEVQDEREIMHMIESRLI